MTRGEAIFSEIRGLLERRQRVGAMDPASGTFDLLDDDRTVHVTVEPSLLSQYAQQLDEHDVPDLVYAPDDDARDRVRARYITRWIEEIFESDISLSLVEIRLDRAADGQIALLDRRSSARRSFPGQDTEIGSWSPDRPAP